MGRVFIGKQEMTKVLLLCEHHLINQEERGPSTFEQMFSSAPRVIASDKEKRLKKKRRKEPETEQAQKLAIEYAKARGLCATKGASSSGCLSLVLRFTFYGNVSFFLILPNLWIWQRLAEKEICCHTP